jgi:hypothetical protein
MATWVQAQIIIGDNASSQTSSKLQIESTQKGFKIPSLTSTERSSINAPAEGLLVFQTNAPSGHYVFNGSNWIKLDFADTALIHVYAENAGGQTVGYATETEIGSWDVPYLDNSSGAFNRSTGVFTAPRDMIVYVSGRLVYGVHYQATSFEYYTAIALNNFHVSPATYAFSNGTSGANSIGNAFKSINGSCAIVNLKKGDELTFNSRHTALNSNNAASSLTTHLNGTYLLIQEIPDYL